MSDATIASRIRLARQALGDSGTEQRYIRTVHGVGFRFVAAVTETLSAKASTKLPESTLDKADVPRRPSIAVLPFQTFDPGKWTIIAEAIPHDLIQALSKLRWILVIARPSSFRFRGSNVDIQNVGRQLGVRYCLTGMIEQRIAEISLKVELSDTRSGEMVWGETFSFQADKVHEVRESIIGQVVAALEIQIPSHEAHCARLNAPENLDAWSLYHLGLQCVYRFNRNENDAAKALFQRAVERDPSFARAHAGLSFAFFQDAFVKYENNSDDAAEKARRHAERAIELDPIDPFANLTMGRYFWLKGELDSSVGWLERVRHLSPNHAQAIYSKSWVDAMAGRPQSAIEGVNLCMQLSPFDPMQYAMLGVRALSNIVRGDAENAVYWAEKAALSPGAHFLVDMTAVIAHAMNVDNSKASYWAKRVFERAPNVRASYFLDAFPFQDDDVRANVQKLLHEYKFPD